MVVFIFFNFFVFIKIKCGFFWFINFDGNSNLNKIFRVFLKVILLRKYVGWKEGIWNFIFFFVSFEFLLVYKIRLVIFLVFFCFNKDVCSFCKKERWFLIFFFFVVIWLLYFVLLISDFWVIFFLIKWMKFVRFFDCCIIVCFNFLFCFFILYKIDFIVFIFCL